RGGFLSTTRTSGSASSIAPVLSVLPSSRATTVSAKRLTDANQPGSSRSPSRTGSKQATKGEEEGRDRGMEPRRYRGLASTALAAARSVAQSGTGAIGSSHSDDDRKGDPHGSSERGPSTEGHRRPLQGRHGDVPQLPYRRHHPSLPWPGAA